MAFSFFPWCAWGFHVFFCYGPFASPELYFFPRSKSCRLNWLKAGSWGRLSSFQSTICEHPTRSYNHSMILFLREASRSVKRELRQQAGAQRFQDLQGSANHNNQGSAVKCNQSQPANWVLSFSILFFQCIIYYSCYALFDDYSILYMHGCT